MDTPATVRIEALGSEAAGYREAIDERRRVLHVRGSTPRLTQWLVRRARWARFDLGRSSLITTSGPWGRRTVTDAWSARAPLVIARGGGHVPSWDVVVERDDGHRSHLATLYDAESLALVERTLRETYRDATPSERRHPFALRFGPLPEGVTCEGDPFDPTSIWDIRVRCARGNSLIGGAVALVLGVHATAFVLATMAVASGAALCALQAEELAPTVALSLLALALGWCAYQLGSATRDQIRNTLLERSGEVCIRVDRSTIEVTTPPWPMDPLEASSAASFTVEPHPHEPHRARMTLIDGATSSRVHAPIAMDDARYVARILTMRGETRLKSADRDVSAPPPS